MLKKSISPRFSGIAFSPQHLFVLLLIVLLQSQFKSHAQDGSRDTTFTPSSESSMSVVRDMLVLPDNRILIGGTFTSIAQFSRNRIVRLKPDGTIDQNFDPGTGADNSIYALALQRDGKILVGGDFLSFNKKTSTRIARLEYTGAFDPTFNIGSGPNGRVERICIQPDGKILVTGQFSAFNSTTKNRIVRLNSDGTVDSSFQATGPQGTLLSIVDVSLQNDGKIWVTGDFTNFNGVARSRITRLNSDGTTDASFSAPAITAPSFPAIYRVAVQSDQKIIIGGNFTNIAGIARTNLARLNSNGSLDVSFNSAKVASVFSMKLDSEERLVVGSSSCTSSNLIFRLNSDGSLDSTFLLGTSLCGTPTPEVIATGFQSSGKMIMAGKFNLNGGFFMLLRLNSSPNSTAPVFIENPLSQVRDAGGSAVMMARASGYPSYQWQKNGTNLFGRTDALLAFPNVVPENTGTYRLIASNAFGLAISDPATLAVIENPPSILTQPSDATVNAGNTVKLTAIADGVPQYQWFFNGIPLPGANGTTLNLPNVKSSDAGNYWMMASNSLGVAFSRTAVVAVAESPLAINQQPTNVTVPYGNSATLSVGISGIPAPERLVWYKNGTNLATLPNGYTSSFSGGIATLSIAAARSNDVGSYFLAASNYLGSATSDAATVTVTETPELIGNWYAPANLKWFTSVQSPWFVQSAISYDGGDALQSGAIGNNQSAFVETEVEGPATVSFSWKASSQTNADIVQFSVDGAVQATISGEADWRNFQTRIGSGSRILRWVYSKNPTATNGLDAAWLDNVVITPAAEPVILIGPTDRSFLEQGWGTFSISAFGAEPLNYQWRLNGTDIPGATNSSLTLTNFQNSQTGAYSAFVWNGYGTANSTNANATIRPLVQSQHLSVAWKKLPGSAPWLPATTTDAVRGVAYNPVTDHVLAVSRTALGTNIWVLDAKTGEDLYKLRTEGVLMEGKFPLNMVKVADDGAVYACNLRVANDEGNFKIYRWPNDSSNAFPALVWQGDPSGGTIPLFGFNNWNTSWGDSMDIRGRGDATQILLGNFGNSGPVKAVIITPSLGVNSDPLVFHIASGIFGPGFVAFGQGDSFWIKPGNAFMRFFTFNGTEATQVGSYSGFGSLAGMGVNGADRKLAANVMDSPDFLALYDLQGATNLPVWIDSEFFTFPIDALNGPATGSVDFHGDRIYAADANNGIIACRISPVLQFDENETSVTLSWPDNAILQSASSPEGPYNDVVKSSPRVIETSNSSQLFFRLRLAP